MTLLYGIMSYSIMDKTECSAIFSTNQDFSTPLGLTYYYSGIQRCPSNHYWMGVRDHYIIHFILDGYGKCSYTGKEYYLKKGQAFLVKPEQRIHYVADSISPWRYCWVAFNG